MNRFLLFLFVALGVLACNQTEPKPEPKVEQAQPERNYEPISVIIKSEAEKTLGGELKAAIGRGGIEEAIGYCNLNAIKLTDSVAARYNATVRRVTDKPRNPQNQADELALAQMEEWKEMLAAKTGQVVSAVETESHYNYYFPITIKPLCTACHGVKGKSLTEANYAAIQAKYPDDKATGYSEGDLRGLWQVSFKNN